MRFWENRCWRQFFFQRARLPDPIFTAFASGTVVAGLKRMDFGGGTRDEKMRRLRVLLMLCSALVFASTVRAQGTAGTNNAELNGDYAFTFNGFSGSSGGPSRVFDAVGRFTADGAGNVTNGELDTNGVGPGATRVAQTF